MLDWDGPDNPENPNNVYEAPEWLSIEYYIALLPHSCFILHLSSLLSRNVMEFQISAKEYTEATADSKKWNINICIFQTYDSALFGFVL